MSIQTFFSEIKSCYKEDEAIGLLKSLTSYITANSIKPPEKQMAWALIELVRSHSRFTTWKKQSVIELLEAVSASSSFSIKQQGKAQEWLASGEWIVEHNDEDGPFFNKYDGPDDIERYQGHGEWDTGDGYWCG